MTPFDVVVLMLGAAVIFNAGLGLGFWFGQMAS